MQDCLNAVKELAKYTVDIERKDVDDNAATNMRTLVEVPMQNRPNRNLEDFE